MAKLKLKKTYSTYSADPVINRANEVRRDNDKIKTNLQNYIFKFVRKNRSSFINKEERKKTKIVFLDVPLLFENNLVNEFDILISIISTKKNRYKRLKKHKNMKKDLFKKIVNSQTTDVVRKLNSDIVIFNNSTMKNYLQKIDKMLDNIVS